MNHGRGHAMLDPCTAIQLVKVRTRLLSKVLVQIDLATARMAVRMCFPRKGFSPALLSLRGENLVRLRNLVR